MKGIQGAVTGAVVWIALRLTFWIVSKKMLYTSIFDIIFKATVGQDVVGEGFEEMSNVIVQAAALGSCTGWVLVKHPLTKKRMLATTSTSIIIIGVILGSSVNTIISINYIVKFILNNNSEILYLIIYAIIIFSIIEGGIAGGLIAFILRILKK